MKGGDREAESKGERVTDHMAKKIRKKKKVRRAHRSPHEKIANWIFISWLLTAKSVQFYRCMNSEAFSKIDKNVQLNLQIISENYIKSHQVLLYE